MAIPRRDFLAGVGAAAVAPATVSATRKDNRIAIGLIGPGGMGSNHLRNLSKRNDVTIAWVCDVDRERLEKAASAVATATSNRPQTTGDLREVLDDPHVTAVFIATPDHWHAPAAILALDAGKHVYVEKPCCHNIREGRLMSDAVQRSGKLLQVGTQSRSTECVAEAMKRIHEGEIGEVLVAKAWNSQRRASIGHATPTAPPANLDFAAWLGRAPEFSYQKNLLHGVWRWWHNFGCGDIGNDGVHDIDVALWGLAPDSHPERAACFGGKYFFDDDQQFPDTQYAQLEFPADKSGKRKQLIFEQRIWTPYTQEGYENGAAFYGTKGVLICGHTVGWRMYGPRNKLIAERTGQPDLVAHHDNFFAAIRGTARLNADITVGHRSATIVHLANIAARMGRVLNFDPQTERIVDDAEADALVRRTYREKHFAVPVDV
ncbi:MAG: Gfo/Idh/MocA family oxidoreductase [Fuerstiella sp.]|nr:Gfo/Idh/MocA family oxidoreductase [Fuerstiella sp.]